MRTVPGDEIPHNIVTKWEWDISLKTGVFGKDHGTITMPDLFCPA
jgi:hypothetical protein